MASIHRTSCYGIYPQGKLLWHLSTGQVAMASIYVSAGQVTIASFCLYLQGKWLWHPSLCLCICRASGYRINLSAGQVAMASISVCICRASGYRINLSAGQVAMASLCLYPQGKWLWHPSVYPQGKWLWHHSLCLCIHRASGYGIILCVCIRRASGYCIILSVYPQGKLLWPPPPPVVDPAAAAAAAAASSAAATVKEPPPPPNYFTITLKDSLTYTAGLGTCLGECGHLSG